MDSKKKAQVEELSDEDSSSTDSDVDISEEEYNRALEEDVPETRSRLARLASVAGFDIDSNQAEMESTDEKLAREKRQIIFKARNAKIENHIAMDLHGLSIIGVIDRAKRNIYHGSLCGAVKSLRVITGCGNHCVGCVGMPNIKQAVLNLCGEEGIRCTEDKENRGVLIIWLDGRTEFAFMDPENDYELKTVVCT